MIKRISLVLATVVALTMGIVLSPTSHAINVSSSCSRSGVTSSDICSDGGESAASIVKTIVDTMLYIAGAVAVIMIIYSGIRYSTSGGNAGSVATAKNGLIYSVVGLVVCICSYAIVNFVIGMF